MGKKWGQAPEPKHSDPLPDTIEGLDDMRLNIIEEMNGIRNQLATRKSQVEQEALVSGSFDAYGKPMADRASWAEYNEWRARATSALRHFEVELGDVKQAIKEKRTTRGMDHINGARTDLLTDDPLQLLGATLKTARRFASRIGHDKIDAEDLEVIDYVQTYLQHRA